MPAVGASSARRGASTTPRAATSSSARARFPTALDLRGLKIVVDCAHGAAYHVAPHVFHELGADVVAIGVEPNGLNINDGVGATAPARRCSRRCASTGADLGIALDGDGDRLLMVDATGSLYDGDQLLYVIAMRAARARRRSPAWSAR